MKTTCIAPCLAAAALVCAASHISAQPVATLLPEPIEVTDDQNLTFNRIGGVNLDVNNDGQPDVNCAWLGISINSIFAYDGIASGPRNLSNGQILAGSKGVVTRGRDDNDRLILRRYVKGETIQPQPADLTGTGSFAEAIYESFFDSLTGGEFFAPENQEGFLGFAFSIGANTHYGWVKIRADNANDTTYGSLWILAHGYETAPETEVAAGAGLVAPLRITSILRTGTDIALTWDSNSNRVYRVESRTNLVTGAWGEISPDLPSGGVSTTFSHTNGASAAHRFYQVKQLP
jgi:hypothetical protein